MASTRLGRTVARLARAPRALYFRSTSSVYDVYCSAKARAAAGAAAVLAVSLCAAPAAHAVEQLTPGDLDRLSIEDLGKIDVSSVEKQVQPLSDAPAAIYVITHEQILRSGATSLPEILRLAPNLEVFQTSGSQYVITARGFSGNQADQNFSDKLLVLIDGRSVYTPLFSGVFWDALEVLPEDIDRIEVISGPGATLWGANAVNGVINIITRKASETQGLLVEADAGSFEQRVNVQYGGAAGERLVYRVYASDFYDGDTLTPAGTKAHDGWTKPQGGFRLDWTPSPADAVVFEGDAYSGSEQQQGAPDKEITGDNLLTRWTHAWADGSTLQTQAYFDRTRSATASGGGHFEIDIFDLDVQDNFALGRRNSVVVGAGLRVSPYWITGTPSLGFTPDRRTLNLSNAFVEDTLAITPQLKLTGGLKLEDDPYSGLAVLPDARLSWKPTDQLLLWGAASRAIRAPTPFDRDVVEKLGSLVFLVGGKAFQPEVVDAYELGARIQPSQRASLSLSAYANRYDDLRTIEFNPVTLFPLMWGSRLQGDTYGLEAWGDYQVQPWWRLSASVTLLKEEFAFKAGSSRLLGFAQLGDDPAEQAQLRSSMDLPANVTLDAALRYVSALPSPRVPAYVELNGRVGWDVTSHLRLSLTGFNLLHDRHQEFPGPPAEAAIRTVMVGVQWRP